MYSSPVPGRKLCSCAAAPPGIIPVGFCTTRRGGSSHGRRAATYLLRLFVYPPQGGREPHRPPPSPHRSRIHTVGTAQLCLNRATKTASSFLFYHRTCFFPVHAARVVLYERAVECRTGAESTKTRRKWGTASGFLLRWTLSNAMLNGCWLTHSHARLFPYLKVWPGNPGQGPDIKFMISGEVLLYLFFLLWYGSTAEGLEAWSCGTQSAVWEFFQNAFQSCLNGRAGGARLTSQGCHEIIKTWVSQRSLQKRLAPLWVKRCVLKQARVEMTPCDVTRCYSWQHSQRVVCIALPPWHVCVFFLQNTLRIQECPAGRTGSC